MLTIETECETDGRWLAEVPALPGAMSYGETDRQARVKVTALALRIVAERIENGEPLPIELSGMFAEA
jgi:predicted RNase H-like HicB family nuclease